MKKIILSIALTFSTISSFGASTSFETINKVIKENLGNGFIGKSSGGNESQCTLEVKYNKDSTQLTMNSYEERLGKSTTLSFVVSKDSDERVLSDQSSSTYKLIYITAGNYVETTPKKKIDRRMITIRKDSVSLEYKSKYNPLGYTAGKGCIRKP